jgi:hypothetical protein
MSVLVNKDSKIIVQGQEAKELSMLLKWLSTELTLLVV